MRDAGRGTPRGDFAEEMCAVRDAINNGIIAGPRLLILAECVITGAHLEILTMPRAMRRPEGMTADGPWELRKKVRELIRSGADGIKTGFINASGFNLVTSVKRDGYNIVAVVLGGTRVQGGSGSLVGSFLGVLIIAVLEEGLRGSALWGHEYLPFKIRHLEEVLLGLLLVTGVWLHSREREAMP